MIARLKPQRNNNLIATDLARYPLSELEKFALSALANQAGSVSVSDLLAAGTLSPENLLNALQSLKRRSFIQQEQSLFFLPPVLRQYGKTL